MPEIWQVPLKHRRWLLKLGLFSVAAAFTYLFFINWCDWVYGCGCTFLWAGAADHCNIHQPNPPHCPWCVRTDLSGIAFFVTLAAQAAVAGWPGALGWVRVVGSFVASPLAAGAAGLVIGWSVGYWS